MNSSKKTSWLVTLSLVVLVQTVLLAFMVWHHYGRDWSRLRMTEIAQRLFSRDAAITSPAIKASDAVMVRDSLEDIQVIHERIARLFEELKGERPASLPSALPPAGIGGMELSEDVYRLQREIDRIFARAFSDGPWRRVRHPLDLAWEHLAVSPGLRMTEDDSCYEILVAFTGVERLGIEIHLDGGVLSITARGAQGLYTTRLRLPGQLDEQNIQAQYENNLLRVRVPKLAEEILATNRQII